MKKRYRATKQRWLTENSAPLLLVSIFKRFYWRDFLHRHKKKRCWYLTYESKKQNKQCAKKKRYASRRGEGGDYCLSLEMQNASMMIAKKLSRFPSSSDLKSRKLFPCFQESLIQEIGLRMDSPVGWLSALLFSKQKRRGESFTVLMEVSIETFWRSASHNSWLVAPCLRSEQKTIAMEQIRYGVGHLKT